MTRAAVLLAAAAMLLLAGCGSARPVPTRPQIQREARFIGLRYGSAANPVVGDVLNSSTGTWTNSPTSYTYQWQRCAGTCSNITGATASTYTVQSADVGDTIDIVVTASNAYGSASQTSAQTGTVASATQTTNCFASPHLCGYPEPGYGTVGTLSSCASLTTLTTGNVPAGWSITGSELTPTGSGTSGSPNTLQGFNVTNYWIYIGSSSYIKLYNDCITVAGSVVPAGDPTVWQQTGTNLTVDHVTMTPAGCSAAYNDTSCPTSSSYQYDIGYGANSSITNSVLTNAEENLNGGSNVTITGAYLNANGVISGSNHTENLYVTCSQGITVKNDTLLNPWDQTANLYADTTTCGSGCTNQLDVENNLIGGGGEPMNWCPNASANSTGTLIFKTNDLARCTGSATNLSITGDTNSGGQYCGPGGTITTAPAANSPAQTADGGTNGTSIGAGQDTHGYWPRGGYFGVDAGMLGCPAAVTWSGNFYDDNGAAVAC